MSASEPLMTHRESLNNTVKIEGDNFSQDKFEGYLFTVRAAVNGVKSPMSHWRCETCSATFVNLSATAQDIEEGDLSANTHGSRGQATNYGCWYEC